MGNEPIILVISAASGTGKSSLTRALVENEPRTTLSISHTTRGIRNNEVDGRDYFFISEQSFLRMVQHGHFIEHANVYGHYYGTSKQTIKDSLNSGMNVVLDIDPQGARQIANQFSSALCVFLLPPSVSALKSRLQKRDRDSKPIIQERLQAAVEDMKNHHDFDVLIVNDDFDAALTDLRALLTGSSEKVRALPEGLLANLGVES